jgi:hypothetical protein
MQKAGSARSLRVVVDFGAHLRLSTNHLACIFWRPSHSKRRSLVSVSDLVTAVIAPQPSGNRLISRWCVGVSAHGDAAP